MEDEDKVDNKSHSSLNFNSIDGREAGKKRLQEERELSENQVRKEGREESHEKERREDESEGQERGMLDEEERQRRKRREEKVKRQKELSMKKGGLKSGRLKRLIHPLDRSVSYVFTVTIFFTLIALISGLPILIIISSLLPITWTISYIFSCEPFHKTTSWNKVTASDSSSRTGLIPLTPIESYWASDGILINNYRRGIATCLLYFDQGLTLEQLKDVLIARVLSKDSMSRFRATIVYKGKILIIKINRLISLWTCLISPPFLSLTFLALLFSLFRSLTHCSTPLFIVKKVAFCVAIHHILLTSVTHSFNSFLSRFSFRTRILFIQSQD